MIPDVGENPSFKRKVEKIHTEQLDLPLEEQPKKKSDLNYDPKTGIFYVEPKQPEPVETPVPLKEEIIEKTMTVPLETEQEKAAIVEETPEPLIEEEVPTEEQVYEEAANADHPEFDLSTQSGEKVIEQAITKLENEHPKERFPMLEYFGQMHGTYLFAQSKDGLYIIDQHAAQERIKYEYFREKIGDVSDDLQELLVPFVLDYPNNDAIKLKEQTELLQEVGIYLEEFGPNSFIVRAHPTWYPAGQEESIIREMIDMLLITGSVSVKKFREATAIMMSCKRSIKANHHLNEAQARVLLSDLAQCENPFNCPHGRPVLIHFSNSDMEHMFMAIHISH